MSENESGFIKIYRSFFEHHLWNNNREFSKAEAWIWILKEARYKQKTGKKMINGRLIKWEHGEVPASIRFLKNAWNWGSKTKVTNFLDHLEKEDMISVKKIQGQNVLSVCNYSTYNDKSDGKKDSKKTAKGQQKDSKKTAKGQNSKKVKKVKKEKNSSNSTAYEIDNSEKWDGNQPINYQSFLEKFNIMYERELRMTDQKRENIRARLRTFTGKEIITAWLNRKDDAWLTGEGKQYLGDWKAAMRNDEKIDKYLNKDQSYGKEDKRNNGEGSGHQYTRNSIAELED